ncbi:unnamed protein product [Arctogadus glacialis]
MGSFRDFLQQLHLYFRNSANSTAVLQAASECLGLDNLKVKEVKDTRWLSQAMAISNMQRNLSAVLAALVEETELKKCPTAKGLYSFLATYRFVASVYLHADLLPHLSKLSKVFQKENVNFLILKVQVPVTMACLRAIKDAGDHQPHGSFLSRLHPDLDNPAGLGAYSIVHEEERNKRGQRQEGLTRDELWARFRSQMSQKDQTKQELDSTTMAVFVFRENSSLIQQPKEIGIIIDGVEVLTELPSVAAGVVMLFRLYYAPNMEYLQGFRFTFEALQKILMELVSNKMSSKIRKLNGELHTTQ